MRNYNLLMQINSAQEYLVKNKKNYETCLKNYTKTECFISLQFIEWYNYVQTFIIANQSIRYQNLSTLDKFYMYFKETSKNLPPIICNNDFPEDQFLIEYQIIAKKIFC